MFSHFTSTIAADIMRTSVRDNANEIEVVFSTGSKPLR